MSNPLLDTSSLPRFGEIRPEHVMPAVRKVIADNRARLDELLRTNESPDFDDIVVPVELMDHELGRVWSPVSHLQSVLGSADWREAFKEALPLLTEYGTELSHNAALQRAYAQVRERLPEDASEARRSALRQGGGAGARRGRARHLVLLGALAVFDPGLAGGDAGAGALLPR